jgi:hypothetical protein
MEESHLKKTLSESTGYKTNGQFEQWRSSQHCQLPDKITAIFQGIFGIYAVFKKL